MGLTATRQGRQVDPADFARLQASYPYGIPTSETKTHTIEQRLILPDGRQAVQTETTTTQTRGVIEPPRAEVEVAEATDWIRVVLAGIVSLIVVSVAFTAWSTPDSHPLSVFWFWLAGGFLWSWLS